MDTAQTNLFYRISQYRFMCVELNLYLDTHPNVENARAGLQCYGCADCSSLLSNTKANTARCSISASPQRKWAAM